MDRFHETIERIKREMGDRLCILAHHYQSDEIVRHADRMGDSLELARMLDGIDAKHVVFCGVWFMAEAAAALARPGQKIHIPDAGASCPMADMAEPGPVAAVLDALCAGGRRIVPLAYVNSSAGVKAVCGRAGGSVCTSANAKTMLGWALSQGDGVLFLPDRHLARNTAVKLNLSTDEQMVLPREVMDGEVGGIDLDRAAGCRLIAWPGHCPIHDDFAASHIRAIRQSDPEARIAVHPESPPETVALADGDGSTTYLINYAAEAPAGSTVYIGTETVLVERLAKRHAPEKTIKPLFPRYCEDMAKITPRNLADLLTRIDTAEPVSVDPAVAADSKQALAIMLEVCSK